MKLRDGVLLVVIVLLFVILAYLLSSKNPKQSQLAPIFVPIRSWFGPAYGGNRGPTVVVNQQQQQQQQQAPSSEPTTAPITTPGPTPPPASPFTLMGYN
jgi:hypothetical protein